MSAGAEKKVSRLFLDRSGSSKKKASSKRKKPAPPRVHPLVVRILLVFILAVATVFMAFPMPQEYNTSLLLGDIAGQDVKADRDLMVQDRASTIEKRQTVRRNSPPVFDLYDHAAMGVQSRVHDVFSRGRAIFAAPPVTAPIFDDYDSVARPDDFELERLRQTFNSTFSFSSKDKHFDILAELQFSDQAERTILQLVIELLNQGIVADKAVLLENSNRGIVLRRLESGEEEKIPYAAVFPSLEEARRLARERALFYSHAFTPDQLATITATARALLRPNLVQNMRETEKRRRLASADVAPVFFQVKQGEMIVREGERVDELARLKLEALAQEADRHDWLNRAYGFFLLALVFLVVVGLSAGKVVRGLALKNRDMLFLGVLLIINLALAFAGAQVGDAMGRGFPGLSKTTLMYFVPLAAGGMLATVFVGPWVGLFYAVTASALASLIFDRSLPLFLYCFLGSAVGLAGVVQVRERGAIVKSSLLVSLVNVLTITALSFIDQTLFGRGYLFNLGAGVFCGLLSGVLTAGLLPLFEMIFRYTTNVKLLELANLDRPVLRELMVQAPGTYHHSVIVGAMVEAAAESIGANPLLAKVSAYYHDLGKMKKPLYFVENQVSGENRHEKLAPSMSSLILTAHVKDGVELASLHKLSPEIIDIIKQHHGTSLIAYFYQKAKNGRTDDQPDINIEDYRYPGPKPQTREAGLVMLADAVEAASRTLGEPTPSRVQGMVQKLINNIFSDGQLDECELTLKDLHLIARSFNKILTGIFHRRIEYPEPASKEASRKPKAANGNHVHKPASESEDKGDPDKGQRKEDLKRLGIS